MAKKTSFKNAAEIFISSAQEPEPQAAPVTDPEEVNLPRGYVIARESKTKRMQFLVRPSTRSGIESLAAEMGVSMNDLVNNILEEYLRRRDEQK